MVLVAEARRAVQVGEYVVERGGQPVGALAVEDAHREEAGRALQAAGFELRPAEAVEATETVYAVGGECTEEEPRPCELSAALMMAEALGTEAGVSVLEVAAVMEQQHATEAEVREAVRAVVGRLPEDMAPQGGAVLEEAKL